MCTESLSRCVPGLYVQPLTGIRLTDFPVVPSCSPPARCSARWKGRRCYSGIRRAIVHRAAAAAGQGGAVSPPPPPAECLHLTRPRTKWSMIGARPLPAGGGRGQNDNNSPTSDALGRTVTHSSPAAGWKFERIWRRMPAPAEANFPHTKTFFTEEVQPTGEMCVRAHVMGRVCAIFSGRQG